MKGSSRIPVVIFYGLTASMALILIISFASALSWINKPFPGFLIYEFPCVGSLSHPDWPGNKTGLRYFDRIAQVEDQRVFNGRQVLARVRQRPPGTPIHYQVESKGKISEVVVPVTVFELKDFFLVFFIPFFGGLALFLLGVVVYTLKPNIRASWVFLILCFSLGSYMVTGFEMQSTYVLEHFHYLIIPLFPATFLHLGLIFPERKGFLNRFPTLEYLIYLPTFILAVGYQVFLFSSENVLRSHPSSLIPNYTKVATPNLSFTFLAVVGLIFLLAYSMFKASDSLYRQRAKTILIGVTIAFFPSVIVELLAFFVKFNFPFNFLVFFVIFFPASFAYSIVRHNLFDADTIIRRTVGYVLATAAIVGVYWLTSVFLNVLLGKYQISQSKAFPIVFILIMILIFNPIRNRFQSLVDWVFFRKQYDDGRIIDKVSRTMTSSLDLNQSLGELLKTLQEDMFIDKSSVMLLDPARREYHLYIAEGERKQKLEGLVFDRDDPLIQILEREKKELTKYDIFEDPKYREVTEIGAKNFETLHASMMIPLTCHDEVVGILNLGEKKSGRFYNRKDLELLRTLANQAALAVENVRLHEARIKTLEHSRKELERLNRAKSIALDHLSHEMRTPLSIITGSIRLLKRRLQPQASPREGETSFETLEKQLNRLIDIHQETDKIIRSYQELETEPRSEEFYQPYSFAPETITLYSFTEHILENVKKQANHRDIQFQIDGEKDLLLLMAPKILEDILVGLVKNAVENTPDEGLIRVVLEQKAQWIQLKVQDFGIGITGENQRQLFNGLFHTSDTDLYTSKKPYHFGAGGKGLDLLRIKTQGQRLGFDISVGSQRCIYLPTDRDLCPGKISACPHCKTREDCLNSGGSTFCISILIPEKPQSLKT
jgi:signal transduction histidine kinase